MDCDEKAVRVFTDANFNSLQDVEYFPDHIAQNRQGQNIDREKFRPRSVGSLYVDKESIEKLEYWIKTHPNRAQEILR